MKTRIKCAVRVRKWSVKNEVAVSSETLVQDAVLHGRTWRFKRGLHMAGRPESSGFCTILHWGGGEILLTEFC